MLIYPAIDLRGGECVRLLQGRFDAVTRYDADPRARVEAFAAAGARWIHVVDLDGAEAGGPRQHRLIGELAAHAGVSIQAGGGVRTGDDIARLLDAGVSRVVVGSAAVRDPDTVIGWLIRFGAEAITLALDVGLVGDDPQVAVQGWVEASGVGLWEALARLADGNPRHLLVTDIGRDGVMSGPNTGLMGEIVRTAPEMALQASGGVGTLADLMALKDTGATAAIVGRALYEGRFTLEAAINAG